MITRKVLIALTLCTILTSTFQLKAQVYPLSDPNNSNFWKLNEKVSDEFDAATIDEDKWYIVGKFVDDKPVYIDPDRPNRKVWIGRAPSQFSGRNYRLADGKLILETRWEPDFPFSDGYDEVAGEKVYFENLTTPCFIGRRMFQYGYMEIKCKAADAEITSSFWATGNNAELDMFEFFGDHRQSNKAWKDQELWWSIHDWSPGKGGASVYTEHHDLGFRVADDFHTYGFDWSETGIKYYIDGELFRDVSKEEIDAYAIEKGHDKGWVIDKELKIWLDQETFPWHGIPDSKADLTLNGTSDQKAKGIMDFEIEYVRVWQRGDGNLIDKDFFGFEAPIEINGKNETWWIPANARTHFTISDDKPNDGTKGLKVTHSGSLAADKIVAFSPYSSVDLPAGTFEISMDVWTNSTKGIDSIRPLLENPWTYIDPIDLTQIESSKWTTVTQTFKRTESSVKGTDKDDRLRIFLQPEYISGNTGLLFVDNIKIKRADVVDAINSPSENKFKVYPNPVSQQLTIETTNADRVIIYNTIGTIVKSTMPVGNNCTKIPMHDLQQGMYLVTLHNNGKLLKTEKVLKN